MTVCAIKVADIVLIPVQPSPYDIWAADDLVRLVKDRIEITEGKLKAAFVVSRRIKGTVLGREVNNMLSESGLPVFANSTTQRQEYAKSVQEGRTVCEEMTDANKEIAAIVNELEEFYHGKN